jgi:hypothetical protein
VVWGGIAREGGSLHLARTLSDACPASAPGREATLTAEHEVVGFADRQARCVVGGRVVVVRRDVRSCLVG